MISGNSVLAIIPARGGSKGLPGKNTKELCGKPLVSWPIQAAKESLFIDKIIVSTDDQKIAEIAQCEGIDVPFLRPAELASDESSTISVIEHIINRLSNQNETYDYCVLLEPTSPLTETSDIDKALQTLVSNRTKADAIVGLSEIVSTHPIFNATINQNDLIRPYIGDNFAKNIRRQDLEKQYFFEGTLYISDIKMLLNEKTFYHQRTLPYVVPKWKSIEVDDLTDFICIEAIMKNLELIKEKEK